MNAPEARFLLYSTLFPNREQPRHGIFVASRLRHLLADYPFAARVVAPVPWYPRWLPERGDYSPYARVPARELRDATEVLHPRYLVVPKLSWRIAPYLLYRASLAMLRAVHREFAFELIDSHFVYPDGVAAVMLGERLGVPVVMTARGNDISLMGQYAVSRRMIQWAGGRAAHVIAVCQALKDAMVDLGIAPERISVMRNGVDLAQFRPLGREAARRQLGLEGRLLLSVGHLIERKGNHVTIQALPKLPEATLLLLGDGPEERSLRALAASLGVADRVKFLGAVPQSELAPYYSAADALVLSSSREGWANVLLEAMACGTPVIATAIWGTPEVVSVPEAGVLMRARESDALVTAYHRLFAAYPDPAATRRYAERFSWAETSRAQYELFTALIRRS